MWCGMTVGGTVSIAIAERTLAPRRNPQNKKREEEAEKRPAIASMRLESSRVEARAPQCAFLAEQRTAELRTENEMLLLKLAKFYVRS